MTDDAREEQELTGLGLVEFEAAVDEAMRRMNAQLAADRNHCDKLTKARAMATGEAEICRAIRNNTRAQFLTLQVLVAILRVVTPKEKDA